jgi:hypothetical protein
MRTTHYARVTVTSREAMAMQNQNFDVDVGLSLRFEHGTCGAAGTQIGGFVSTFTI